MRNLYLISALLLAIAPAYADSVRPGTKLTVGATPVLGTCTSGYNLYNAGGVLGCQANGGSSTLTIGTTATSGGTAGGILYDSGPGTLQESSALVFNPSTTGSSTTGNLVLTPTWNTSGVVDAGIFLNVANTASGAASKLLDLQYSSATKFSVDNTGAVYIGSSKTLYNAGNTTWIGVASGNVGLYGGWLTVGTNVDLNLYRDAAGILAQRNGTNAQVYRVYNTYTNGTNYEAGVMDWQTSANVLTIGAQAVGTGTLRGVNIVGASLSINGTAGVTCSGTPTSSFASTNGIVTHC